MFLLKNKNLEKQKYADLPGIISCIYEEDWCLHSLHHVLWEETLQFFAKNNGESEEEVQKIRDAIVFSFDGEDAIIMVSK